MSSALDEVLAQRFLAPLARPRTRRIGIELEYPIAALAPGAPVNFGVVHALTAAFLARFGFAAAATDEEGHVFCARDAATGDAFSYDCSYNTLELSFAPVEDLNDVHARFTRQFAFADGFLREHGHALHGCGINPGWRVNRREPIPASRYRMLLGFLRGSRRLRRIGRLHDHPDFGLFTCASQCQIDLDEGNAVRALNAFNRLEPFKAALSPTRRSRGRCAGATGSGATRCTV